MENASRPENSRFSSHGNSPDLNLCGRPSFLLEASEEEWVKKARELIPPLLAEAGLVQAFKGKWMMISMRLRCLSDALSSILDSTSLQHRFRYHKATLSQIVGSLLDGKDLVQKSTDLSYCGKLLMQSNLDSLVTKLDRHLRDLDEVKSFVDQHERTEAITIAMASDGSFEHIPGEILKKEQVWGMFAKLRSEGAGSKTSILETLIDYMSKDDKAALLIRNEGDVSRLIRLLDSSVPAIKERAAHIFSIMAMVDECRKGLIEEGLIRPLLRVMESGNKQAKEKAALTLFQLTCVAENAHAVAAHSGAISTLVKLCKHGTETGMLVAGGTLCNLSRNEQICKVLVECGAVGAFISLLMCSSADVRQYAAKALHNLVSGKDNKVRDVIAKQGGMQSLVEFLKCDTSADAQEIVIEALGKFVTSAANVKALISAGYVVQLTELLNTGCARVQHLASFALCNLSAYVDLKRQTHGQPFIRFLEGKDFNGHKIGAVTPVHFLRAKHASKSERQLLALSDVVHSCKHSLTNKISLSAISSRSSSSMQRRRVMSAEMQPQVDKLPDTKMAGVNKFLLKVGGKKLLNLLNTKIRKRKSAS